MADFAQATHSSPVAMRPSLTHGLALEQAIRFQSSDILPTQALKQMKQACCPIPTIKKHIFRPHSAPFGFSQELRGQFYFRISALLPKPDTKRHSHSSIRPNKQHHLVASQYSAMG